MEDFAIELQEVFADRFTLACMESCTGGLISSTLTDVPGSGYLMASAVCYGNEAKVALGVSEELIEAHGVVSSEVAADMARAARAFFGTDYSLATTGAADGSLEGVPAGTVWVGIASPESPVVTNRLQLSGDRAEVKREAVKAACRMLLATVMSHPLASRRD